FKTTENPSFASRFAIEPPIPPEAPVTIAIFFITFLLLSRPPSPSGSADRKQYRSCQKTIPMHKAYVIAQGASSRLRAHHSELPSFGERLCASPNYVRRT